MPSDLEERLERVGAAVPRPSDESRERARQAVLNGFAARTSAWQRLTDLTRHVPHRRPSILAVGTIVLALGILLATPALGFRDGLLDFLSGENAKAPEATSQTAICPPGRFRVAFDALKGAVIATNGERLAFASYSTRAIEGECDTAAAIDINSYSDALLNTQAVYRTADLVCTTSTKFTIDAHPIRVFDENGTERPELSGTNLIVSVASTDKPQTIVSAVLKNRNEGLLASRVYYAPRFCEKD
jgi:hypothetical protein